MGAGVMGSKRKSRFYVGSLREWHWISSAICLVGMLLFSATGITLNHAQEIKVKPIVTTHKAELPAALLNSIAVPDDENAPLPDALLEWLIITQKIDATNKTAEWSENEIYLSLPRPGGDAWVSIDLVTGELIHEVTNRGWIAYLNDLHKGRHTGIGWRWFIDIFAIASLLFCFTGLLLLKRYAKGRSSTWYVVAAGFGLPLVFLFLFTH